MKHLLLFFIFLAQLSFAQKGTEQILVTDLTRIKQISNIAVAPDGKSAVYALRSVVPSEDNKLEYEYRTHLFLTDFQSIRQITRGSESVSGAVWSPDSKQLAFSRNVKGKAQIFVMPLDGGEAFQLTNGKYGAFNPNWSKDGTRLSFSATLSFSELLKDSLLNPGKGVPLFPMEKPGFKNNDYLKQDKSVKPNPDGNLAEIRAYLLQNEEDKKAKVFNRLEFQGEATTQPELSFTHVFVTAVQEGAKVTPVTTGFVNYAGGRWLSDSTLLLYADLDGQKHPDRDLDGAVWTIHADGSRKKLLLGEKGMNINSAIFSPDGSKMLFFKAPSEGVNFASVYLANADGSNPKAIEFDRSIAAIAWSKDAKSLYFTAGSNGGQPMYRFDLATQKIERLTNFDSGILSFDLSTNAILYAQTAVSNPNELYVADFRMGNARKLSNHNEWVSQKALSFPQKYIFTHPSTKQTVEYWIMPPTKIEPGKTYPLMVNMHGGPTAMWGPGEFSMWHEFQYFCAQGYGIVYANPRGSGGYGLNFQRANIKDWGTGPAEDVLAAAGLAARQPWVDTTRQVLTGGSYAGYLTAWIVGHDHRFKAAFAQRGVYDLTTFLGEGNAWRLIPSYFNFPWDDAKEHVLESNSPYSFVQHIRTPLLIKHGENDLRTGPIQSEMMYKSLKILGKDVEYVRMPGATHELSRTGNVRQRIDRMLRIYEFFERYIGETD